MDLDALAALAGNTIVAAAVTDAFDGVRAQVARIFGRGAPESRIQSRLDQTRKKMGAAAPGDLDSARMAQLRQWQTQIVGRIPDHPEAPDELRTLIAEFRP